MLFILTVMMLTWIGVDGKKDFFTSNNKEETGITVKKSVRNLVDAGNEEDLERILLYGRKCTANIAYTSWIMRRHIRCTMAPAGGWRNCVCTDLCMMKTCVTRQSTEGDDYGITLQISSNSINIINFEPMDWHTGEDNKAVGCIYIKPEKLHNLFRTREGCSATDEVIIVIENKGIETNVTLDLAITKVQVNRLPYSGVLSEPSFNFIPSSLCDGICVLEIDGKYRFLVPIVKHNERYEYGSWPSEQGVAGFVADIPSGTTKYKIHCLVKEINLPTQPAIEGKSGVTEMKKVFSTGTTDLKPASLFYNVHSTVTVTGEWKSRVSEDLSMLKLCMTPHSPKNEEFNLRIKVSFDDKLLHELSDPIATHINDDGEAVGCIYLTPYVLYRGIPRGPEGERGRLMLNIENRGYATRIGVQTEFVSYIVDKLPYSGVLGEPSTYVITSHLCTFMCVLEMDNTLRMLDGVDFRGDGFKHFVGTSAHPNVTKYIANLPAATQTGDKTFAIYSLKEFNSDQTILPSTSTQTTTVPSMTTTTVPSMTTTTVPSMTTTTVPSMTTTTVPSMTTTTVPSMTTSTALLMTTSTALLMITTTAH